VLRVQCNANHDDASIDGLLDAFRALAADRTFPVRPDHSPTLDGGGSLPDRG
jgi:hypothetical protein